MNNAADKVSARRDAPRPASNWVVRLAQHSDIDALLELAHLAGPGFTNLPRDREALRQRIEWSIQSCENNISAPRNEMYLLFLEDTSTGRIGGTACLFSRVGAEWPFYSYKLGAITHASRFLGRSLSHQLLYLSNDFDGSSEVGGLFLDPGLRTEGLGRLLARSRYLFIAQHRARFADRVLADLRGWTTEDGRSPFWDGLGRLFFDMPFHEADQFGSVHGNQFIADLMPKHPIYVAMLPEAARAVIGRPHDIGGPAMTLLRAEGFSFDGYVDIFDAGPTLSCATDQIRTVHESRTASCAALENAGSPMLLAHGALADFRAWIGEAEARDGSLLIAPEHTDLRRLSPGDLLRHAPF